MEHKLKNEFKEALYGAAEVHCALYYFLQEAMKPEWQNWKTYLSALLQDTEEMAALLGPLKKEETRKRVFMSLKSLSSFDGSEWNSSALNFSQCSALVWCYFHNGNIFGRTLAKSCLELSALMNEMQVKQMSTPGWLIEKIYVHFLDFNRLKLKAHPALKHPLGPYFQRAANSVHDRNKKAHSAI